jgi:hypothetical protein
MDRSPKGINRVRDASVDEIVNPLGEFDVELGHSADIMGGELEGHLGVFDRDVRVMLSLLCDFTDVVDEVDSIHELFEFERAGDGIPVNFPFRAFFQ